MFLLHNLLLPLSKGWTSKPSTAETGQHTGQWRPARLEQHFRTCVHSDCFREILKSCLSSSCVWGPAENNCQWLAGNIWVERMISPVLAFAIPGWSLLGKRWPVGANHPFIHSCLFSNGFIPDRAVYPWNTRSKVHLLACFWEDP